MDSAPGVVVAGHYEDTLRKVDGAWKFAKRSIVIEFVPTPAPAPTGASNRTMTATHAASRSARFRELLRKPPFVCLGAHDAVTAKLAEAAGAPAIYVSGFVASRDRRGPTRFGVLTQTEMFEHIRRICRVTSVPVFADADTGYGGVLDAQRTIELWEEAGASVLHLEDQAMPKKCGHFAGKQLIPAEEMQQKLRAMLAARRDPDFFVVARTDAMGVTDLDDAIRALSRTRRSAPTASTSTRRAASSS